MKRGKRQRSIIFSLNVKFMLQSAKGLQGRAARLYTMVELKTSVRKLFVGYIRTDPCKVSHLDTNSMIATTIDGILMMLVPRIEVV